MVIPFKDREITTMVAICHLKGEILIPETFTMLPVTLMEVTGIKRNARKVELPHSDIPGAILSMRYDNAMRGIIIKTEPSAPFKNSITVYMSIPEKNVNFRLSASTVHLCGIKSIEQAHITIDLIIKHLQNIQAELDYIKDNPEAAAKVIKHAKYNLSSQQDKVILPSNEHIDARIFAFAIRNINEHSKCSDFITELMWILSRRQVFNGVVELDRIETSMVNLNYTVGFPIDRLKLALSISGKEGFTVIYDNAINHSVTITLPFDINEDKNVRRKKKSDEDYRHTFMVYRSGCVTQSGPSLFLMEFAYNKFNKIIEELRPYIENKSKSQQVTTIGYEESPSSGSSESGGISF